MFTRIPILNTEGRGMDLTEYALANDAKAKARYKTVDDEQG
jgi:hypothetical protein